MADKRPPRGDDARRPLDRNYAGEAKNAHGDKVGTELGQETCRLQRGYESDSPKKRH